MSRFWEKHNFPWYSVDILWFSVIFRDFPDFRALSVILRDFPCTFCDFPYIFRDFPRFSVIISDFPDKFPWFSVIIPGNDNRCQRAFSNKKGQIVQKRKKWKKDTWDPCGSLYKDPMSDYTGLQVGGPKLQKYAEIVVKCWHRRIWGRGGGRGMGRHRHRGNGVKMGGNGGGVMGVYSGKLCDQQFSIFFSELIITISVVAYYNSPRRCLKRYTRATLLLLAGHTRCTWKHECNYLC